jgi:hypothetical protein
MATLQIREFGTTLSLVYTLSSNVFYTKMDTKCKHTTLCVHSFFFIDIVRFIPGLSVKCNAFPNIR